MIHTLTIYGKNVRVSVQSTGLNVKAASEVQAHFLKTVGQAVLDAPHVGTMKEHQRAEVTDDAPKYKNTAEAPYEAPATPAPTFADGIPDESPDFADLKKATKNILKAKKGGKKAR